MFMVVFAQTHSESWLISMYWVTFSHFHTPKYKCLVVRRKEMSRIHFSPVFVPVDATGCFMLPPFDVVEATDRLMAPKQ